VDLKVGALQPSAATSPKHHPSPLHKLFLLLLAGHEDAHELHRPGKRKKRRRMRRKDFIPSFPFPMRTNPCHLIIQR
jgi:hypothetical protein